MPYNKRKRSRSSYSRPYRRRRGASTSAVARRITQLSQAVDPYGPGSERFKRYGPSMKQIRENPGASRTAEQSQARLMDGYYGAGKYSLGKWGARAGGALLGATTGGGTVPGTLAGALTGYNAGSAFSKSIGWGEYDVGRGSNDLGVSGGNGSAPVMHTSMASDELGDVTVSNRELVQLVKSSETSGAFKIQSFTLNPVDQIFHHLRYQAKQYEQFEFLGLHFQYIPMTGEGGTNEIGVIGMGSNYDPAQVREFSGIEDLMRFKGATTHKPSVGMLHFIECDPAKRAIKTMYVRDTIERGKDFTDPATFYIASEGVSGSNQTLGQLWVSYTVKLKNIKPIDDFAIVTNAETGESVDVLELQRELAAKDLQIANLSVADPYGKPNTKQIMIATSTADWQFNLANIFVGPQLTPDNTVEYSSIGHGVLSMVYPTETTHTTQSGFAINWDPAVALPGTKWAVTVLIKPPDEGDVSVSNMYAVSSTGILPSLGHSTSNVNTNNRPFITHWDDDYSGERGTNADLNETEPSSNNIAHTTFVCIIKPDKVASDPARSVFTCNVTTSENVTHLIHSSIYIRRIPNDAAASNGGSSTWM